jgi:hypothetical protein
MQDWIQDQMESGHHRTALLLFPVIIFLGYIHPVIFGIGLILFFLITSFRLLRTMLFYMLILGGISAIFPPLAPIILIVMIVLFIMRIGYVFRNWRPFVGGLLVYGAAGVILGRTIDNPYLLLSYNPSLGGLIEPLIVSSMAYFGLKAILLWLYRYGYSSFAALGIMGSVPLIIISFILPFLKMHIGGDFYMPEASFADGHTAPSGEPVTSDVYVRAANGDVAHYSTETGTVNGTQLQQVQGHLRTAPDGDPTNNLSYKGPDAKPVEMKDMVYVNDYVRTAPDGDLTNNLSYKGPGGASINDVNVYHDEAAASVQLEDLPEEDQSKVIEVSQGLVVGQAGVDRLLHQLKRDGTSNQ